MKNIIISNFVLLFISCTSLKDTTYAIPYIIDLNAEKSIYKEVLKSTGKSIVFYIEHLSDSTLKFHLINFNDKDLLATNRKLFINDKLYPIIFDTDYLFYSEMKDGHPIVSYEVKKNIYQKIYIPTIQVREKNPELYGYKKKSLIIDHSIYWILDKNGKLLRTNIP